METTKRYGQTVPGERNQVTLHERWGRDRPCLTTLKIATTPTA